MQNAHNEMAGVARNEITGVLLAGGKSLRMGHDKACIEIAGQTLVSRSLDLLRQAFARVLIAGDRPDLAREGLPAIADLYPGSALGGLYTGLRAAQTDWIFVAPCDMPFPDPRLLEVLIACRAGYDAVVPRTPNGYEPVFALYHKNCLPLMEEMLRNRQYRIYDFYQRTNVRYVDSHDMPEGWERALLNVNTPEQLARLREELQ